MTHRAGRRPRSSRRISRLTNRSLDSHHPQKEQLIDLVAEIGSLFLVKLFPEMVELRPVVSRGQYEEGFQQIFELTHGAGKVLSHTDQAEPKILRSIQQILGPSAGRGDLLRELGLELNGALQLVQSRRGPE